MKVFNIMHVNIHVIHVQLTVHIHVYLFNLPSIYCFVLFVIFYIVYLYLYFVPEFSLTVLSPCTSPYFKSAMNAFGLFSALLE